MNVIIDANVAIAAAASRGLCEAVMELCLEHHRLILSEGILSDIAEKLRRKIKVAPPAIEEFVKVLRHNADILKPVDVASAVCRDPDDLMVLGLVGPGQAQVIVTGDKDLLVIKTYGGARIMTPRGFWASQQSAR